MEGKLHPLVDKDKPPFFYVSQYGRKGERGIHSNVLTFPNSYWVSLRLF